MQPAQSRHVQMVVVIVTEQHGIDLRQGLEGDPGCPHAPRAREGERARPFRPYGVGQNVETTRLDQHARVADDRRAQPGDAGVRNGLPHRDRARPGRGCFLQLPAQEVTKAAIGVGVIRVEEAQTVEMIARQPGIIRIHGSPQ